MTDRIRELLAQDADELVRENFRGVRAEWWWERRISGGIAICQELDPEAMTQALAGATGRTESQTRKAVARELGLDDWEPVVLTYEMEGDTTAQETAALLRERSATPEGIASALYRRVAEALSRR